MLTIATWNVNSIKMRLPHLVEYLKSPAPDILMLQEIKCLADGFPHLEIEAAGYQALVSGQKTYNGVAIIAKKGFKFEAPVIRLAGDEADEQARYLEATVAGVRVAAIYLPNGNPIATDKFKYKLAWMERLRLRAKELLAEEKPTVMAGDWNVCPTDEDVWDLKAMKDDALVQPQSRAAFRRILKSGLDRRDPRASPARAAIHVLGLHAEPLAARPWAAHRSSAAVAAGGGPLGGCAGRPQAARQGEGVRSHGGVVSAAVSFRRTALAHPSTSSG